MMMRRVVHEAGHAVVCFDVGIGVEYVTLASGQGRMGYCQYEYGLNAALKADFLGVGREVRSGHARRHGSGEALPQKGGRACPKPEHLRLGVRTCIS